jgi:hypothetical protein
MRQRHVGSRVCAHSSSPVLLVCQCSWTASMRIYKFQVDRQHSFKMEICPICTRIKISAFCNTDVFTASVTDQWFTVNITSLIIHAVIVLVEKWQISITMCCIRKPRTQYANHTQHHSVNIAIQCIYPMYILCWANRYNVPSSHSLCHFIHAQHQHITFVIRCIYKKACVLQAHVFKHTKTTCAVFGIHILTEQGIKLSTLHINSNRYQHNLVTRTPKHMRCIQNPSINIVSPYRPCHPLHLSA